LDTDEVAARLVRQYWAVLVICVLAPLIVVGVIVASEPAAYAADARIITSSGVPASAAAADAIVSQVQAIATGRTAASQALRAAGVRGNLGDLIANISVSGVGASQVVNLTVTDANPKAAQDLARAVAAQVVSGLNRVGASGMAGALAVIDADIARLSENRAKLAAQVVANPHNQQLQAKLAGLDQVLANFTGDRARLLIQASSQGVASVIDEPGLPVQPESKALPQKLGLAALLGLVLGILLAAIGETIRPTVPGCQRVSRRLNAPTLGRLIDPDLAAQRTPDLASVALRVRLAASHADVSTVALVDVDADSGRDLAELASELEQATAAPSQVRSHASPPTATDQFNGNGDATSGDGTAAATLIMDKLATVHSPVLRVCSMTELAHRAETGRVGILVLSGAVARASRISALDDLAVSSGWPILGVVGVPRLRTKPVALAAGWWQKIAERLAGGAPGSQSQDHA
jgi:capsular polysaccharide biosynthesis protein